MREIRVALYLRSSTVDQHPEIQRKSLRSYVRRRGWHVYKEYCDHGISGSTEKRPALEALLDDCKRRKVDVVAVWKFDRFGRSLRQLVNALELFRQLGISFVSCTEALDTSLPHGEMLFQIIGAIAQWERTLIAERVRAGIQNARLQGKQLGRPALRKLTSEEIRQLRRDRRCNKTAYRKLAAKFGISVWTAHQICNEYKSKTRSEK